MRQSIAIAVLLFASTCVRAGDPKPLLTPKEIADGWLMWFDGETTFGLQANGNIAVKDGVLILGTLKETTLELPFSHFELRGEIRGEHGLGVVNLQVNRAISDHKQFSTTVFVGTPTKEVWNEWNIAVEPGSKSEVEKSLVVPGDKPGHARTKFRFDDSTPYRLELQLPPNNAVAVRNVKIRPLGLKPIFNGKNLDGWRTYSGDPKRTKTEFSVTADGWLSAQYGPGDLQTTGEYADFLLQLDCMTNGPSLNSGVFFRAIPGQYQQGYEAQIHNGFKDGDRSKPVDFGTGAIYRRIAARRVVSNDKEWLTMTVLAKGNRMMTWVNGYPTVDWTDNRPKNDNARNGSRTAAGAISIQGHDPTTNLNFRNIRILELK